MIAAKILGYYWIEGKLKSADITNRKPWSYPQAGLELTINTSKAM